MVLKGKTAKTTKFSSHAGESSILRVARAPQIDPRSAKLRLECDLNGKLGPRNVKLRLESGLEAKKGVLEGQIEKRLIVLLLTERDRCSASGSGEGKEGEPFPYWY